MNRFDDIESPVLVLTPDFPERMLEDEGTRWLRYYFLDAWNGVEKNPLVERRTIEEAGTFVWLDHEFFGAPLLRRRALVHVTFSR